MGKINFQIIYICSYYNCTSKYFVSFFLEYLKENNAVINNKYQEIAEWKERIKKYHKHNQEKCEEAKTVILNLRSENEDLRKQLQETKNQAFYSLVSVIIFGIK